MNRRHHCRRRRVDAQVDLAVAAGLLAVVVAAGSLAVVVAVAVGLVAVAVELVAVVVAVAIAAVVAVAIAAGLIVVSLLLVLVLADKQALQQLRQLAGTQRTRLRRLLVLFVAVRRNHLPVPFPAAHLLLLQVAALVQSQRVLRNARENGTVNKQLLCAPIWLIAARRSCRCITARTAGGFRSGGVAGKRGANSGD